MQHLRETGDVRTFFYELSEGLRIALRAIWGSKMRAVLTTLGIVIGILSVTAMATVINGIERGFEQDMAMLGTDVLYVERMPWSTGPNPRWWEFMNRPHITLDVEEAIQRRSRLAEATTPVVTTNRMVRSEHESLLGISVEGVKASFPRVHAVQLGSGAFFSEIEEQAARNVAVIGAEIADRLIPVGEAVGSDIRIGGERFRVVGVLERQGSGLNEGLSRDSDVYIPLTSFRNHYGITNRNMSVHVRVASSELLPFARDELTGIVRTARRLDAMEEDNFAINEHETLRESLAPTRLAIYLVGIFLTALALLVGGIGVMNIMFVSVKERTREIGIRKAVGARRSTIMLQFLIEAVIVCLIGGLIGLLLSFPIAALIRLFLPAYIGLGVIMVAFVLCVVIGIIFGLAPAWQAAKARPIEALRYE